MRVLLESFQRIWSRVAVPSRGAYGGVVNSPFLLDIKGRMRAAIDPTRRFRLVPVQVGYAVTFSRLGGDDRFSGECQQIGILIESPDNAATQLRALKSYLLLELLEAWIGLHELRHASVATSPGHREITATLNGVKCCA